MRAVIITGGRITDYAYIKSQIRNTDTIICADSGYNHAIKMGVRPSIVLGDFDSISHIPTDIKILQYPSKKDETDTEIAIDYARENGFTDFLLLAATGTRIDHSLTNILLLKNFVERGEKAMLIDEHNKIMLTNTKLNLEAQPGEIVSLVPLTTCYGVCTKSLEYPLYEATLQVGKGLGVSNIIASENATVSLEKGLLLVIIAKD